MKTNSFVITQNPLNCNGGYVARSSISKEIPFLNGGSGVTYDVEDFFTYTLIAGCNYDIYYGDTCGTALTGTDV